MFLAEGPDDTASRHDIDPVCDRFSMQNKNRSKVFKSRIELKEKRTSHVFDQVGQDSMGKTCSNYDR